MHGFTNVSGISFKKLQFAMNQTYSLQQIYSLLINEKLTNYANALIVSCLFESTVSGTLKKFYSEMLMKQIHYKSLKRVTL